MNWKPFCIMIAMSLLGIPPVLSQQKFRLSPNISAADYKRGEVWVKVKSRYKEQFENLHAKGRLFPKIAKSNFRPLMSLKGRDKVSARLSPKKNRVDISQFYKVSFDQSVSVEGYINDLYATGFFEVVEPVYLEKPLFNPNDPAQTNQYYLGLVKAQAAWDITKGSSSIVIGIVDTGGDLNHPDLQSNIYTDPADPTDGIDNDQDGYIDNNRGWDFSGADVALIGTPGFKGDNNPSVYSGGKFVHGTMVAGCASASTNNGSGIAGVGFNTKLLFTKHYADNQPTTSTAYSSNLYDGVLYAATHGAKIINCSWGNPYSSAIAQELLKFVTLDLGCLVIAAAGNSNSEAPLYPAAYDYVFSVASSDENDLRAWFSNYGKTVDIVAPGANIYTTSFDNGYKTDSGTSLSAPIVAGAAALVWGQNPTLTPLQVAEQLRISADETFYLNNAGYTNKLGNGRLDIARALTLQSPSIRASKQELVNDAGILPEPGQAAKLYLEFTNFLKPTSSGLVVKLTSSSPHLTITQGEFRPGAMGTNITVKNKANPFKLTLAADFPIDVPVAALLTFTDGVYHDTQPLSFTLPSFIDVNENNITTTITSTGRIGYSNPETHTNGSGFVYNDNALLYEMGIIMGTSSSVIYDNVRGVGGAYNQDFTAAKKIEKHTPGDRAFSEVTGVFRNAPTPDVASLVVSYRSMVWNEDPYKNFVILEYKIKNTKTDPVTNFHMGLFADWDIQSGGSSDKAAWDNATRLGYAFPAQPSTLPRVGVQALTGSAHYYAIDNDNAIAGNPWGIFDGFTDAEKFAAISSELGKTQAGGASGGDISHVVSTGPYTINGSEELTIAFALHGANTLAALINSAKYADSLYNYTFKASKPSANNVQVCDGSDAVLEATGASQFKWYKNFTGGAAIHSGPRFTIPDVVEDTILYVSNADQSYESLRTAISVSVVSNPVITSNGLAFCQGSSLLLAASGGDEYTWSNEAKSQNIEVTSAGTYSVVVRDGNVACESAPVTVTMYPSPVPQFEVVQAAANEVELVNLSTGATSWQWNFGDGTTSNDENPTHKYLLNGEYTITLSATSDKGCVASANRSVGIITGLEQTLDKTIVLYPNPIYDNQMMISHYLVNEPIQVNIFNALGELVYHQSINPAAPEHLFDVSRLSQGIYHVKIDTAEGSITRKVSIVRH
jgi:subtilisin family serine protease